MKIRSLIVFTVAVLSGFAFSCNTDQSNNNKTPNINVSPKPSQSASPSPTGTPGCCVHAQQLIDRIKKLQERYVRESYGIEEGECFTRDDLKKFKDEKIPEKVVQDLKRDKDFASLVEEIKTMPADKRQELLDTAGKTYKKTWRELGLDPKTASRDQLRGGQTEEGQQAEKLIAEAIVTLVKSMI